MLTLEAQDTIHDLQRATEQPIKLSLQQENYDRSGRNLLPQKIASNSVGTLYYRADYELRWLRVVKRCRNNWDKCFVAACKAKDWALAATASKELREWCERERALLRIARPAAQIIKEKRGVSAPVVEAVTITEQSPDQGDAT